MKKILMLFLFFVLLFLTACSSQETSHIPISIHDHLRFSYASMTYTDTREYDILFEVGNPSKDFIILYNYTQAEALTIEEVSSIDEISVVLTSVSIASAITYSSLLELPSQDFNELAASHSITLTLSEIVAFNEMKTKISVLKNSLTTNGYLISKIDYIENRIDRQLTTEEITSLELLQDYFYRLNYPQINYTLNSSAGLNYFSEAIQTITVDPPTVIELSQLELAYAIIELLSNQ